jgi:hypothetical protein
MKGLSTVCFRRVSALSFLLCVSAVVLYAQPGDPGGGADPDVPLTGIEVLIGLGGALGLKKMMSKKKNNL